jgi:hypothetical protein
MRPPHPRLLHLSFQVQNLLQDVQEGVACHDPGDGQHDPAEVAALPTAAASLPHWMPRWQPANQGEQATNPRW